MGYTVVNSVYYIISSYTIFENNEAKLYILRLVSMFSDWFGCVWSLKCLCYYWGRERGDRLFTTERQQHTSTLKPGFLFCRASDNEISYLFKLLI